MGDVDLYAKWRKALDRHTQQAFFRNLTGASLHAGDFVYEQPVGRLHWRADGGPWVETPVMR